MLIYTVRCLQARAGIESRQGKLEKDGDGSAMSLASLSPAHLLVSLLDGSCSVSVNSAHDQPGFSFARLHLIWALFRLIF